MSYSVIKNTYRTNYYYNESESSLLLDLYGEDIVGAYSVRRLTTTYQGPLLRIRRSSDNATQDINFTSQGDLDEFAIILFTGAGNTAYVDKWYDQSGNGLHMESGLNPPYTIATSFSPVSNPTILTKNSRPTIEGSASAIPGSSSMSNSSYPLVSQPFTFFEVFADDQTTGIGFDKNTFEGRKASGKPANQVKSQYFSNPNESKIFTSASGSQAFLGTLLTPTDTNLHVYTKMVDGSSTIMRADSSVQVTSGSVNSASAFGGTSLGAFASFQNFDNAFLSEFLIYDIDKSTDFAAIEQNQKDYFNIP